MFENKVINEDADVCGRNFVLFVDTSFVCLFVCLLTPFFVLLFFLSYKKRVGVLVNMLLCVLLCERFEIIGVDTGGVWWRRNRDAFF